MRNNERNKKSRGCFTAVLIGCVALVGLGILGSRTTDIPEDKTENVKQKAKPSFTIRRGSRVNCEKRSNEDLEKANMIAEYTQRTLRMAQEKGQDMYMKYIAEEWELRSQYSDVGESLLKEYGTWPKVPECMNADRNTSFKSEMARLQHKYLEEELPKVYDGTSPSANLGREYAVLKCLDELKLGFRSDDYLIRMMNIDQFDHWVRELGFDEESDTKERWEKAKSCGENKSKSKSCRKEMNFCKKTRKKLARVKKQIMDADVRRKNAYQCNGTEYSIYMKAYHEWVGAGSPWSENPSANSYQSQLELSEKLFHKCEALKYQRQDEKGLERDYYSSYKGMSNTSGN